MLKNQKGTTLVSVMVSFAILLIIIVLFSRSVTLSLNLSQKADTVIKDTTEAVNAYHVGGNEKTAEYMMSFREEPAPEVGGATKVFMHLGYQELPGNDKVIYYFKGFD